MTGGDPEPVPGIIGALHQEDSPIPAVEINAPRIVHDEIDREVIAIDLATGTYYSMRGSARALWRMLSAGPSDVDGITDVLLRSYPAAPPEAADEVRVFLTTLVGNELVRPTTAPTVAPTPLEEDLGPYAPPAVEAFTDMQELVLLDPVHDVGAVGWPARPESTEG